MAYAAITVLLVQLLSCTSGISLVTLPPRDPNAALQVESARSGQESFESTESLSRADVWRQLGNLTSPVALRVKDPIPALAGCYGFDCVTRYCLFDDGAFSWGVAGTRQGSTRGVSWTSYDLKMSSQAWMAESTGTAWYHALSVVVPEGLGERQKGWATLVLGGTASGSETAEEMAARTGAIAVALGGVPNSGLSFREEGRYDLAEETLKAWSWTQYAHHADHPEWPVEMPNVKAVVRAMDAVTDFTRHAGGLSAVPAVERFVVTGESKRGMATYMAGAVDPRVSAIIPLVISLDLAVTGLEGLQNLGGSTVAMVDYLREGIFDITVEEKERLYAIIDPINYVDQLTMPKLAMFAGNDAFFPPDVSRSWWPLLPEPKAFHFCGSAPHGGYGPMNDFMEVADTFINGLITGTELPRISWTISNTTGAISVRQLNGPSPTSVSLWSAQTEDGPLRDFRRSLWSRSGELPALPASAGREWLAELAPLADHWTGFYVLFEFAVAPLGGRTWSISTEVSVVPNTRPFPDADRNDPRYQGIVMAAVDGGKP